MSTNTMTIALFIETHEISDGALWAVHETGRDQSESGEEHETRLALAHGKVASLAAAKEAAGDFCKAYVMRAERIRERAAEMFRGAHTELPPYARFRQIIDDEID